MRILRLVLLETETEVRRVPLAAEALVRSGRWERAAVFGPVEVLRTRFVVPRAWIARGRAEVVEDEPGRLRMRVEAQAGGTLHVAEAHAPGWRATVDGSPATVGRGPALQIAVAIPPGRSSSPTARPASPRGRASRPWRPCCSPSPRGRGDR